jgi:hypothetical protein
MRQSKHEPKLADRLKAARAARAALLARFKPKPAVQAPEVIPWAEREAQRVRELRARPKPPRVSLGCATPGTVVVVEERPVAIFVRQDPAFQPVRYSAGRDGIVPNDKQRCRMARKRVQMVGWKIEQWKAGNRTCAYCACALLRTQQRPNSATVDHVEPLRPDGSNDVPENYAMACATCNNRKARMSAAAFLRLLAADGVVAERAA